MDGYWQERTATRGHAERVINATECGEVEGDIDPDATAMSIAALVDGLAVQLYPEPDRAIGSRKLKDAALQILQTAVHDVFSGECHHYRYERNMRARDDGNNPREGRPELNL